MKLKHIPAIIFALTLLTGCASNDAAAPTSAEEGSSEVVDESVTEKSSYGGLIELPEYNGITISTQKEEVSDADARSYAEDEAASSKKPVEKSAATGDVVRVTLDCYNAETGASIDGSFIEDYEFTVGDGTIFTEIDAAVVGMNKGESKIVDLNYPDESSSEGIPAKCTIKLTEVYEPYTLDEEYVSSLDLDNVSSVEVYIDYCKDKLQKEADDEYETQVETEILNNVIGGSVFYLDYSNLSTSIKKYFVERAKVSAQNMSTEDVSYTYVDVLLNEMQENESDKNNLDEYLSFISDNASKAYIVSLCIAEKEGITVSDDEVDELAKQDMEELGLDMELQEFYQCFDKSIYTDNLYYNKVLSFIKDNAIIEDGEE